MGLCRVLEEDPLLRTGAPNKPHYKFVNSLVGFHHWLLRIRKDGKTAPAPVRAGTFCATDHHRSR